MWDYTDRRIAQEVGKGLWLGPYTAAKDEAFMKTISHVLIVAGEVETKFLRPQFPEQAVYRAMVLEDSPYVPIFPLLIEAVQWIRAALVQGGRVLVHGNSGMSRSAAVVVGYLIAAENFTYDQAFRHVQSVRQCVSLSDSLKIQLKAFEPYVRSLPASGACTVPAAPGPGGRRKRGREDITEDSGELFFEAK